MKSLKALIVLVLILIGVIIFDTYYLDENQTEKQVGKVQSEAREETKETSPTPSPTVDSDSVNLDEYVYPAGNILERTENSVSLESSVEPKTITDWYKEKIESNDMNVRTFIQTNSNNNVVNRLVGTDGETQIRVDIVKKGEDMNTKVQVIKKAD